MQNMSSKELLVRRASHRLWNVPLRPAIAILLENQRPLPIASVCMPYMDIYGNIYHQYTPVMLASIPYIRILWVMLELIKQDIRQGLNNNFRRISVTQENIRRSVSRKLWALEPLGLKKRDGIASLSSHADICNTGI